ncbi:conserved hypothetical protein [Candidatus Desulfarcum epimagneticum]|uniref:Uncharacterized protein n=1 Tax=uncultured Desulfobacteraceae bacterium TaxID=218296 RepID=A0A484HKT7_9BACT|nr:conserved hypothetical protein [uncultured Desulfobacteraceae bacterium]
MSGSHLVDMDKTMDRMAKELDNVLKSMSKAKTMEEKELYSRTVKNLSESLGVFFKIAEDVMSLDLLDDDFLGGD